MSEKNETVDQDSTDPRDLELEKLRAKNKELLAEKQKAKQAEKAAQDALDEAEAEKASKSGDIEALKAAHAKELKKAQDVLAERDNQLRTITVDNEITKALAEGNVRPEMSEALTALLKSKVEYANGSASIEGNSIGEAVTSYLSTETGAHFRRAADNSGSGATGNSNATATNNKPFNTTEYSTMRMTDQAGADAWAVSSGNAWIVPRAE